MIVDLGCGGTKRGDIGIDVHATPAVDYIVHLGVEPLPFADNSVDRFVAYDFLEHLPVRSWVLTPEGLLTSVYSRIQLIREVYRCLKPGGTFFSRTPGHAPEWAQDPTHEAPPWLPETWDYYCGSYAGVGQQYGITFAFELVDRHWDGPHLCVELRKPQADS